MPIVKDEFLQYRGNMTVNRFLLLVLISLFLQFAPEIDSWYLFVFKYLHLPFTWLETFFHEVSHGIVATLTGGRVFSLEFELSGEGRCSYTGGLKGMVYFAGYAGASLWGAVLFLGATASVQFAHRLALGLVLFILLSGALWVEDGTSWLILVVISVQVYLPLWFKQMSSHQMLAGMLQTYVQFLGIYVLVNSARSALYLIQIKRPGDDTRMMEVTNVPEVVWILLWAAISAGLLLMLLGHTIRTSHNRANQLRPLD